MDVTIEEIVTICLLLLFLTHFYVPILEPVQTSLFAAASEDQTLFGQCVSLGAWIVAGGLILRSFRLITFRFRQIGSVAGFVSLALLSAVWSQDGGITLRKAIFLILTTAFGIYFAQRHSVARQMQLICIAAFLTSLLSILFALLLPKYGIDHDVHEGAWLGIFTQKNVCAREMLFLFATIVPYRPTSSSLRACRIFAILAVVAVILGTQSKTALLLLALLIMLFPTIALVRELSKGLLLVLALIGMSIVAGTLLCATSPLIQLVALLGRDGTMTGRTQIWQAVLEAIAKRPLLGYGFAAFWLSLRGESANIILALHWAVPAAHNGFLDIWLQLGAAGLALFMVGFLIALRSACRGIWQPSFSLAAWPLAVLALTLVYNFDESSLMQPNDFLWVLYVATLTNLANSSRGPQPTQFVVHQGELSPRLS